MRCGCGNPYPSRERIYISARPEGGSWATLGTIRLRLDDGLSKNGNQRYGETTVAGAELRVWQDVRDALRIEISARLVGGHWGVLGNIPLPLNDGHTPGGGLSLRRHHDRGSPPGLPTTCPPCG